MKYAAALIGVVFAPVAQAQGCPENSAAAKSMLGSSKLLSSKRIVNDPDWDDEPSYDEAFYHPGQITALGNKVISVRTRTIAGQIYNLQYTFAKNGDNFSKQFNLVYKSGQDDCTSAATCNKIFTYSRDQRTAGKLYGASVLDLYDYRLLVCDYIAPATE